MHKSAALGRACLFLLVFSGTTPVRAQGPDPLTTVKKSLICTCDCSMTVETCEGSMACTAAAKLANESEQLLNSGLGTKAVLASFVEKYGESILAEPNKRGFNLLAWVLPFLALGLAGAFVTILIGRWARAPTVVDHEPVSQSLHIQDVEYVNKLNDYLNKLDS